MTRRSFITSTLQALALVGAVKLGLGNMTAEDVRISELTADRFIVFDANKRTVGRSLDGSKWTFDELPIGREYFVFDMQSNSYTTEVFNSYVVQVSSTLSECYPPKSSLNLNLC